ncbi:uncharacterized protein LOC132941457 [Metopolophium dirhodum]|uniref:uncharacterized protein LOC132941457 n=1 Tax=Metopolophium dirhodum TaxID=44670 RepID=UPI00298F8FA2|nr:uncharacterized protein LOC132941457 [Metopolophium dirhodum]
MTSNSIIKISSIISFINDTKIFSKGENSFECGYVVNFHYLHDVGILSGQVHASMKNRLYDVKIFFKNKIIEQASCTCSTGQTKCHHMVSLLLHGHKNISVTDISCSWSKKSVQANVEVCTIDDLYTNNFKAVTDTQNIDFKTLCLSKLLAVQQTIGFAWLLSPEPPVEDYSDILILEHAIHSEEFSTSQNRRLMLSEVCKLSAENIKDISSKTIGQAENIKWCLYRNFRLTSSNFHKIIHATKINRYPNSLFKTLLGKYVVGVKSIEWGRTHEVIAIQEFEKVYKCNVIKTGIWLHESGFLGASPDGLLLKNHIMFCIEVKCPYKFRNENLNTTLSNTKDNIVTFDTTKNDFVLNSDHQYYHQIQGQIYMTKRS